jgi:hypothetical protein
MSNLVPMTPKSLGVVHEALGGVSAAIELGVGAGAGACTAGPIKAIGFTETDGKVIAGGNNGRHLLMLSISQFDPQATFWGAEQPAVILSRFKPAVAGM